MSKRLSEREINAVRAMRQDGHTMAYIANVMGVSVSTISTKVNPTTKALKDAWNRGYRAGIKRALNK